VINTRGVLLINFTRVVESSAVIVTRRRLLFWYSVRVYPADSTIGTWRVTHPSAFSPVLCRGCSNVSAYIKSPFFEMNVPRKAINVKIALKSTVDSARLIWTLSWVTWAYRPIILKFRNIDFGAFSDERTWLSFVRSRSLRMYVCIYKHTHIHEDCDFWHIIYYRYSALGPVWAETTAQSVDWYSSGTLHPGQVLRGSLPLLSPAF